MKLSILIPRRKFVQRIALVFGKSRRNSYCFQLLPHPRPPDERPPRLFHDARAVQRANVLVRLPPVLRAVAPHRDEQSGSAGGAKVCTLLFAEDNSNDIDRRRKPIWRMIFR